MKKLIESMLEKRIFAFLIIFFIIIAGLIAYRDLKIDVFPDPSPVLVQIHCEAEGMAPEEVEKFVSYPLETSLYGLPHIEKITSFSTFGLSTINVYFDDGIDIHFARQLVAAQLPAIQEKLPEFVEHPPELGPITTGLGMVYIYALEGDLPAIELRTLQDWVVKFQLQTMPGIAAVLSQGGDVKQFQVVVDAEKLIKYKTGLHQVIENIKKNSRNITAGYIVKNKEEYIIRGVGLMEDMESLKKVLIKESEATPIYLENVAEIKIGEAIKRGDAMLNTRGSTVSGIVMKLIGVNTAELIERISARIAEINAGLPEGVRIVPVYNQALIINAAFKTISDALIIGIILVAVILFVFINDLSSSIVSTLSIPFALFVTLIVMRLTGMTADLMSFGGLAIGIGLLVDATVVVVENISRHREEEKGKSDKAIILEAVNQVLRPLTYAMFMIILSFVPILTLRGVEGKLFRPFGFTLLIAIVSAIIYAVFLSPVLMNVFGNRKLKTSGVVFETLKKVYLKVFDFFYGKENLTIAIFVIIFILSVVVFLTSGSEFIPTLNEQTIQMEMGLPQSTALDETVRMMDKVHKELKDFPEIETMYGRIGRGEGGTHPHPVNIGHTIFTLKDRKYWTVDSYEELIEKIRDKIKDSIPGLLLNFTQPIKHNLDHLLTGVRADLAIKIYGDDYNKLLTLAQQVKGIMETMEGVRDIQLTRVSGQNEIAIKLDRGNLARYGLSPGDVLEELEASIGGKEVSRIYQGDVAYDVFVRYSEQYRKNLKDLRNVLVHTEKGQMVPLSSVASVKEATGFSNINRENGKRYITVQCNARGRDIGSIVHESREKIYSGVEIPFGYYLSWGGQFELKQRAERRLYVVLFITFFLIVVLLFDFLKRWKDIVVILFNLPVSLSGGVFSLWLAGAYLSVPSSIGFLALLGIALENTLILISFFKRMTGQAGDFDRAIREGVGLRLRPILMTKFTTIIGLFPLLFSVGIGSEIQKPLVVVVIGGIFFSIFTTLLLMPVMYKKFYK